MKSGRRARGKRVVKCTGARTSVRMAGTGLPSWTSVLAVFVLALASACRDAPVEKPVPLFDHVPIQYPADLWDQGVEGRTVLRVRVDTAGSVDSAEVAQSSGQAEFDSAALAGGRRLHFRPATRNGDAVAVWARVPVEFSKSPPPDSVGERSDSVQDSVGSGALP